MKRLTLILAVLRLGTVPFLLGMAGGAQAQASPQDFCAQAEPLAAQPACRTDYMRAARLVRKYTDMNGLSDRDGAKIFAIMGSVLNWHNLLSARKTPGWIMGHCDEADSTTGWLDLRKMWDCIVESDPDAALLEAI